MRDGSAQWSGPKTFASMKQEGKFVWGQQKQRRHNGPRIGTGCNATYARPKYSSLTWLQGV